MKGALYLGLQHPQSQHEWNSPLICILFGRIGGAIAGIATSSLYLVTRMSRLLSSIIIMTALYTVILRSLHGSNLSISEFATWYSGSWSWYISASRSMIIVIPLILLLTAFFHTEFGLLLRASGENWNLIQKLGKPCWLYLIITLAISNCLVGISGSLLTQYNGFADVGFGSGSIITH